ncbi:hypothetical protein M441DRAFT_447643 [Trichoderma asperellum CBS 433.97]|uniref:FAD-binding PCMH-type domain-containing protein n=1 Tax=Trichoderma asperellum (strain ATCC 204424 / CBS 433.97 / NBRC 101777) TaxID=1042311 RepID=A0A2T3YYJ0_TRIA4|nr:hypothetical protein M441DRAFT_447643 [Trichoderma asperellum CBS 433.97]PTB37635.1 hypothetical protein M441DRAFT_447643 [Trichoderma asperellum CBS 433.97]
MLAQAEEITPVCSVFPADTEDVVSIIDIVREAGATFAVKSGGHSTYSSGSNAENGININLSRLKDINISEDRKFVTVGSGCRFGEIYSELENLNLGCVGGRVSSVGVGGLVLGGGLSFFSSERGLACDNVISYELVLVNGQVLKVTHESYPDLFWAMRGAGLCFGIVTRFELKTFEMGKIWGGSRTYAHEHEMAVLDNFSRFVQIEAVDDPLAHSYIVGIDAAKDGNCVYSVTMSHGSPKEPPAFDDFKQLTPLDSTTQTRTLKSLCDELDTHMEPGVRYHAPALTIKYDRGTLKEIINLYAKGVELLKDQDDFAPAFVCQPLLPNMLPKDDIGNAMGIKAEDGPLILFTPVWRWTNIKHDESIYKAVNVFMEKAEKAARARGTFHRYRVLNYSAAYQDIYGGYGEENRKRLLEIRAKYDPDDIMSKLRPGIIQLLPKRSDDV